MAKNGENLKKEQQKSSELLDATYRTLNTYNLNSNRAIGRVDYENNESIFDDVDDIGIDEFPLAQVFQVPNYGIKDYFNDRINFQKGKYSLLGEPGWFYFKIFFKFNTNYGLFGGLMSSELKHITHNADSALRYLYINRKRYFQENLNDRLVALFKFASTLSFISSKAPWFFNNIKGLDKANLSSYENIIENKSISIGCLEEAVDMRLTTLLDLYRFICYDDMNQKEILPVNLRKFDMDVMVFHMPLKYFHTSMRVLTGNPGKWNYKTSMDANNFGNNYSFKLYSFQNCEFALENTTMGNSLSNERPFNLGKNDIVINYDRVYTQNMNEWNALMFGSDGIRYNGSGLLYELKDSKPSVNKGEKGNKSNNNDGIFTQAKRLKAIKQGFKDYYYYNPDSAVYKSMVDASESMLTDAARRLHIGDELGNLYEQKPISEKFRDGILNESTNRREGILDSHKNENALMEEIKSIQAIKWRGAVYNGSDTSFRYNGYKDGKNVTISTFDDLVNNGIASTHKTDKALTKEIEEEQKLKWEDRIYTNRNNSRNALRSKILNGRRSEDDLMEEIKSIQAIKWKGAVYNGTNTSFTYNGYKDGKLVTLSNFDDLVNNGVAISHKTEDELMKEIKVIQGIKWKDGVYNGSRGEDRLISGGIASTHKNNEALINEIKKVQQDKWNDRQYANDRNNDTSERKSDSQLMNEEVERQSKKWINREYNSVSSVNPKLYGNDDNTTTHQRIRFDRATNEQLINREKQVQETKWNDRQYLNDGNNDTGERKSDADILREEIERQSKKWNERRYVSKNRNNNLLNADDDYIYDNQYSELERIPDEILARREKEIQEAKWNDRRYNGAGSRILPELSLDENIKNMLLQDQIDRGNN